MRPLHHDPIVARAYTFASHDCRHEVAPCGSCSITSQQVVALRIELSVMALSGPSGRPVLDYRFVLFSVPRGGVEPTNCGLKARYPAVRPTGRVLFRCALTMSAKWAGRRSNPRYLIFSQALYRLSYQPIDREISQRKRPDVALTPGLVGSSGVGTSVISAAHNRALHSPFGQMFSPGWISV